LSNPRWLNPRIRSRSIPNHNVRGRNIPNRHLPRLNASANTSRKGALADSDMSFRDKIVREEIGPGSINRNRNKSDQLKIALRRISVAMPAIGCAATKICHRNSNAARLKMIGSSEGCRLHSNTGC
jgi:hypothetical protein